MNIYAVAIFLAVMFLLIYICDTRKIFHVLCNPYLVIIFFGIMTRIFFLQKYGYDTDVNCFMSWSKNLYKHGLQNFYSLKIFKDYPPGYMYILYVLGALKDFLNLSREEFLCLIKIPAVIADIISAILIYKFSCKKLGYKWSLLLSLSYAINPAIIFDSTVWGQVDSIYTLFLLAAIYFVTEKKYLYGFITYTLAILVKPQAFIFAPIFLYALYEIFVENKSFYLPLQYVLCSALIFIALLVPFTQNFNFIPIINQYIKTFSEYKYFVVNAFNSYMYLNLNWFALNGIAVQIAEVILLICITLFAFWFLVKSQSRSKYFFTAAILNVLVFVFTFKMHERYLYPAIIFFLMAFIYQTDKKYLLFYGGFSFTLFINCFMVYHEKMANGNVNVFSEAAQIFSLANVFLTLLMIYFAKNIFAKGNEKILDIEKKTLPNFKIQPAEKIEPSQKLAGLTKKDWLMVLLITFSYSLIAFFYLGNTKSPQSFFHANKNDFVIVDFKSVKNIGRMQIFNGIRPDKKIEVFRFNKHVWEKCSQIDIDGVSSVFKWHEKNLNTKTRFLKLKFLTDDTYIQEIAFRDKHDKILPLRVLSKNCRQLFDEQYLVPKHSDYMNSMYFDEVYHARTGYEFLHKLKVYETTHPPLGKNFIALGIKIFGMTPFGWRFFGTLFGVLMLPIFYLLAKKIFSYTTWATFATILFSLEFMHFEQTRIATVDSYTVFFIILMYLAMYIYYGTNFFDTKFFKTLISLFFCAIFSGLACATKWQGFYALAGLVIIFFATIFFRYKEYLYAVKFGDETVKNKFAPLFSSTFNFCIIFIFLILIPIYFSTYFLYLKTEGVKNFADVIKNQNFMFNYHAYLNGTHSFGSKWWQWILNLRPILFYSHSYSTNLKAGISCFANPIICYGGLISFFYCLAKLSRKFDKIAFFLLIGYLAQIVPWIFIKRVTFEYHYFPCIPFLILMLTYFVKDYAYPKFGKKILFAIIAATAILFFMFYPVISGMPVSKFYVDLFLKWFASWQLY